jgi:hypothetical protein
MMSANAFAPAIPLGLGKWPVSQVQESLPAHAWQDFTVPVFEKASRFAWRAGVRICT